MSSSCKKLLYSFITGAAFLALSNITACFASDPDPLQILRSACDNQPSPYRGRVVSIVKDKNRTRVSETTVLFKSFNCFRREFFDANGKLEKIVASDGETEDIYFPGQKTVWQGEAGKIRDKIMNPDDEWKLVSKNYNLQLKGSDRVAGRPVWIVRLVPALPGKPEIVYEIDKQEPVILQTKQFDPEGEIVTRSYFTDIDFTAETSVGDKDVFRVKASSGVAVKQHGLDPDFLSMKELNNSGVNLPHIPETLPQGFEFESGNSFKVKGSYITHIRYTDGIVVLSLFEGTAPIISSDKDFTWGHESWNPAKTGFAGGEQVLSWKSGNRNLVLVGCLSKESLSRIAKSIR